MTLRVGIGAAPFRPETVEFVRHAERLGVDSVWCPEFWAGDAFTPLAYLAGCTSRIKLGTGIAQIGARTPAMLAMTAQSLHALSGGRCLLGIGTSGPQVMEGWHGVTFDKPGRVDVFCSIHSAMSCVVLVLENPFFARTDAAGTCPIVTTG